MFSQNQSSENRTAGKAVFSVINQVEGFDPEQFAVEYLDEKTGEVTKRLPVMVQMAWFRMKYPEGRISVKVANGKECFVATARVYPSYKDGDGCYLAEATASRGFAPDKPSVSPREWAQTAAVGIALRNAGFGLQFFMAGDEFPAVAPDELGVMGNSGAAEIMQETVPVQQDTANVPEQLVPVAAQSGWQDGQGQNQQADQQEMQQYGQEMFSQSMTQASVAPKLTYEERIQRAMETPCPIKKYSGKTLGDMVVMDPGALNWVANKFKGEQSIIDAARMICEYAMGQASA